MPFNPNDVYTTSGNVMLFNAWTPYVSKYDTSSFYNWEQDNLPLYDLEERTYELWEQQGFTTSAGVPGLALSVSADTPAATLTANRTIFTDLSSCIAAIPKVIRFPVFVEVANFGDLGPLELHNFRIEEGGSLEIINRGFGRTYCASSQITNRWTDPVNELENGFAIIANDVSSLDLSNTLVDTSCMALSTPVFSATNDERAESGVANGFIYPLYSQRRAPISLGIGSVATQSLYNSDVNEFKISAYEKYVDKTVDATLGTLDISAYNQADSEFLKRKQVNGGTGSWTVDIAGAANFYTNVCTKISVKNCDGPIYIRNFFVDGETTRKDAIEITNSDVLLENCAGVRAQEAGFKFNNSKVILSRSAVAYRNYKLESASTRASGIGIGFHAVNSDVTISALPSSESVVTSGCDLNIIASRNYAGFKLDNSKLVGGYQRETATNANTGGFIGSEQNTGYGIILNNSEMDTQGLLDVYGNNQGILADGSKLKFQSLCIDRHTEEGIISRNSSFIFDSPAAPEVAGQVSRQQLDLSANGQHINLQNNSYFGFALKDHIPAVYGNSRFADSHAVLRWNGDKKFALPAISVNDNSEAELLHADIRVDGTVENVANVPSYGRAIKASSNSKVSCFGTKTGCTFVWGPPGFTYQQKMAGIYAQDSSEINIHGPAALGQFGVDILVEDNSTLNIEPARSRDAFGLEVSAFDLHERGNHTSVELHSTRACLVANKNSNINMADLGAFPANWVRDAQGQEYLDRGFDYPINTFDISAFTSSGSLQFYPNPQDTTAIGDLHLDDLTNVAGLSFTLPGTPTFTDTNGINRFFVTNNVIDGTFADSQVENLTQGGVCLRATEDSVVNVKNVHFPIGPNTSPLNGHYYTTSGSTCDRLMIWNIADTSRLNASFLSVSGLHPGSAGYQGPSAIWVSSDGGTGYNTSYGAPSKTPDTGALSIFDAFGAGSSVWVIPSGVTVNNPFDAFYPISGTGDYLNDDIAKVLSNAEINVSGTKVYKFGSGPHTANNQGVFRIYWSPKASARILQNDLSGYNYGAYPHTGDFSGVVGPAYQIFAQGYNCSAPLSALPVAGELNASSVYPELLKLSYDSDGDGVANQLWTSGFYYCKEFLDEDPTQCMLDESAAETFANSKNASLGLAHRPRKVTLYRSRSDAEDNPGAEAFIGEVSGSVGLKSVSIFDLSRDN